MNTVLLVADQHAKESLSIDWCHWCLTTRGYRQREGLGRIQVAKEGMMEHNQLPQNTSILVLIKKKKKSVKVCVAIF